MLISLHSPRPLHPNPPMFSSSFVTPPTPPHELRGTVISTFSPHLRTPSPPSYPTTGSNVLMGRSSFQLFVSTRSRVIRIFNLPKDASSHLPSLFHPITPHAPLTLWTLREQYGGPPPGDEDSVWAVFKSHDEAAAAALALSGGTVSVATALEADLEPFQKLRKLELRRHSVPNLTTPLPRYNTFPITRPSPPPAHFTELSRLGLPPDPNTAEEYGFTLSTNPPNPRNTFRQGDWICASANCAAHNFMRNLVCIGCGSPRPIAGPSPSVNNSPWARVASSPRFAGVPPSDFGLPQSPSDFIHHPDLSDSRPPYVPSSTLPAQRSLPKMPSLPSFSTSRSFSPTQGPSFSNTPSFSSTTPTYSPASPSFPNTPNISTAAAAVALKLPSILTPSGRAFSIGGKVQNVSSDPLVPCVLYWPDNEPFPEQGQIRPAANVGAQPPPILNTGNKGPIEQQPGDWVCKKCDYLNWRRRKVCQTCFPYAEGNTDGVSASVQAERISMLAQILSASQPQPQLQVAQQPQPSSHPQLLVQTNFTNPPRSPHAHSIPTPPNEYDTRAALYTTPTTSPESEYFPRWSSRALLPSFLNDDDYEMPSPATPPLSVSSGSSSPQSAHGPAILHNSSSSSSLAFAGGGLSSIWSLRKEEVDQ